MKALLPALEDLPSALAGLSNDELLEEVERLARDERETTARLVVSLAELDDRRLYREAGCSSLFTFCTEVLHLSEHAAYRRIEAARAARRFPVIPDRLECGDLTLTAVSLLGRHLTPENHLALLNEASHRSRRAIELLVAHLKPRPDVIAMVRRLPGSRRIEAAAGMSLDVAGAAPPSENGGVAAAAAPDRPGDPTGASTAARTSTAEDHGLPQASPDGIPSDAPSPGAGSAPRASWRAGEALSFHQIFGAAGANLEGLLLGGLPEAAPPVPAATPRGVEHVPTRTDNEGLTQGAGPGASGSGPTTIVLRVGPVRPHPSERPIVVPVAPQRYKVQLTIGSDTYHKLRRAQDLLRHVVPNGDLEVVFDRAIALLLADLERHRLGSASQPRTPRDPVAGSRHIPAAVKRGVWERDGGRCAFQGTHGRCTETGLLQFHHRKPFAVGGEATVENIELRCARHNEFEAEVFFGAPSTDRPGSGARHGRPEEDRPPP